MRLYVQWTKANAEDWVALDLDTSSQRRRVWERLPKKAEPVGGEIIDNAAGWVFAVNVQGVHFEGYDHYAVVPLASGGLRVIIWNDDPADFTPDTFVAQVWTFETVAPDPKIGGALNTRQSRVVYAGPVTRAAWLATGPIENTVILPWADFTPPSTTITFHGIWTTNPDQHYMVRAFHGWEEWR